jgi:hypothetical protein
MIAMDRPPATAPNPIRPGSIVEVTRNGATVRFVARPGGVFTHALMGAQVLEERPVNDNGRGCPGVLVPAGSSGLNARFTAGPDGLSLGGRPVTVRVVSGPPAWN